MQTTTRNASLQDMVTLLQEQQARKLDIIAPATQIHSVGANLYLNGVDGVAADGTLIEADGTYLPTSVFDQGLAEKLDIPRAYLRRLRAEAPDIYDSNVNKWLQGHKRNRNGNLEVLRKSDPRSFMLRLFRGQDGDGVARAFLSNRYKAIDDLDFLMAALDGITASGVKANVVGADLSESRMYVRVAAPEIQAYAPELLKNYTSPFTGNRGADNPLVFAGFQLSNSEVGGGAWSVTPRLEFQVCKNGMTIKRDAMRGVHLGTKLEEGVIDWSEATQKKSLELVSSKVTDAVRKFLDVKYMEGVIAEAEKLSGKKIDDAVETIKVVGTKLAYDQEAQKGILAHFIDGGDRTAGGLMNAITSYSQLVQDADKAADLEGSAFQALSLV
jgi:hypothetical protein